MSGGSYNYLCFREPCDLRPDNADLARMVARLDGLKDRAPNAAVRTRGVLAELTRVYERIAKQVEALSPVWKAVEWCDSSDWGEDRLHEALAAYEQAVIDGEDGDYRWCAVCEQRHRAEGGTLTPRFEHEHVHSEIVDACVDVGIRKAVEHITRLGLTTVMSCQGDQEYNSHKMPYVDVRGRVEEVHQVISKLCPNLDQEIEYRSAYAIGIAQPEDEEDAENREAWVGLYRTRLAFPQGLPDFLAEGKS